MLGGGGGGGGGKGGSRGRWGGGRCGRRRCPVRGGARRRHPEMPAPRRECRTGGSRPTVLPADSARCRVLVCRLPHCWGGSSQGRLRHQQRGTGRLREFQQSG